jgi:hypothetical protein
MAGTNKLDKAYTIFIGEWSSLFIPDISDEEKDFIPLTPSVKSKKAFFFITDDRKK